MLNSPTIHHTRPTHTKVLPLPSIVFIRYHSVIIILLSLLLSTTYQDVLCIYIYIKQYVHSFSAINKPVLYRYMRSWSKKGTLF